ncbi:hypothetical protein COO60DRAFT_1505207 [Scenedesmus sp. NREL 46B-D3]|nr:hypothetical protein COO60DRAFT_1505207 [Scenedesmus sp. NREL 46B-D3]
MPCRDSAETNLACTSVHLSLAWLARLPLLACYATQISQHPVWLVVHPARVVDPTEHACKEGPTSQCVVCAASPERQTSTAQHCPVLQHALCYHWGAEQHLLDAAGTDPIITIICVITGAPLASNPSKAAPGWCLCAQVHCERFSSRCACVIAAVH